MIDGCFAGLIDESVVGVRTYGPLSSEFYKKYTKTRTGLQLYTLSVGPLVRSGPHFITYPQLHVRLCVMSPALFNIYVNDLVDDLEDSNVGVPILQEQVTCFYSERRVLFWLNDRPTDRPTDQRGVTIHAIRI